MDLNFNANEHEEMADFSVLPKGWYMVMVTKDEQRDSKSTPGAKYLSLEYTILNGAMKGRKIFVNLNLWHTKQDVVAMAQRELKSICTSINKVTLANSQDLYNIPFGVKVNHRKDKMSGEMRENISAYCGEKEFASKAGSVTPAIAAPSTTTSTGGAPWSQK